MHAIVVRTQYALPRACRCCVASFRQRKLPWLVSAPLPVSAVESNFVCLDRSSSRGARRIRSSRDNPPARRAATMLSGILNRQLTRRIGPDRRLFSSRNLRRIQFLRRYRTIVKEWRLSKIAGISSRLLLFQNLLFLNLGAVLCIPIQISFRWINVLQRYIR